MGRLDKCSLVVGRCVLTYHPVGHQRPCDFGSVYRIFVVRREYLPIMFCVGDQCCVLETPSALEWEGN